ncbi:hypothetical protein SLEP1_g50341 [Rubroshorea leprosula]|uniref:Uncharacterized protein n=1 Tax=Rubroshorea leprosula TaxID=152421 RepID=A0AAV5LZN7_9ROSI|nr:hypothetical protein SLEP1_g50341 [Rubroshorea leprosula]
MVRSFNVPLAQAHDAVTMVQGMQSFVPPMDRQCAKGYIQQHGGHATMLKLMDAFSYADALFKCEQKARGQTRELTKNYKRLASKKASLEDEVNELKEKLDKGQAKRGNKIQATRDEASHVEDYAKHAEADRIRAKKSHQCFICITRAQRAKWLVGSEMFQDVVAVASANTITEIYNDIHGKLRWELNEERVSVWPSSVVEEEEDVEGLPSFDAWVVELLEE